MSLVGDTKIIIKKIKKNYPENISSCILALMGSTAARTKIAYSLIKGIYSIPDIIFYTKLEYFLNGTFVDDSDRAKLRAFLATNGNEEENFMKLLNSIHLAESKKKIDYINNATRCALNNEITLPLYFRVCNAINTLTEDDFYFLSNNVYYLDKPEENNFNTNYHIQKLFSIGAMRIITTIYNAGQYEFTYFAKILDASSINFANDTKYPNRKKIIQEAMELETQEINNTKTNKEE